MAADATVRHTATESNQLAPFTGQDCRVQMKGSCTLEQPNALQEAPPCSQDDRHVAHADLRDLAVKMGMCSDAIDGWAQYNENPVVTIAFHFTAQIVLVGSFAYLITGAPLTRYYHSVPLVLLIVMQIGHFLDAWRFGPNQTARPIIKRTLPGPARPGSERPL